VHAGFCFFVPVAMHAPTCFGKFACVVGMFSKATPACKVLLYFFKSFQNMFCRMAYNKQVLESFHVLLHGLQQTCFVFFFRSR
jgi:hypothetical protein